MWKRGAMSNPVYYSVAQALVLVQKAMEEARKNIKDRSTQPYSKRK